ncbi:hypothetical protein [Dongia sp.]|uniref:hypothetical protein n=1 Tax=Dongia sp. TaxID=1977262 RepID=UPI0037512298
MTFRRQTLPRLALILAILFPPAAGPAQAETTCKDVPGIKPEIARFLGEVSAAQAAGQGTLPLNHVFFGFTYATPDDLKALEQRVTVELKKQDAAGGDYLNKGAEITVEGEFAADPTWVRMPLEVRGRYAFDADGGLTLTYNPAHTVELGERHLGMFFFKTIRQSIVKPDYVAFYLDDNAGPDPDRCYNAVN